MRIFNYWEKYTRELEIDGLKQLSTAYGGSNVSREEAIKDAQRKLGNVVKKAERALLGKYDVDKEYEADIREEIIERLDAENIITRNRYGALVLNSTSLVFIDIDQVRPRFWESIWGPKKDNKTRILEKIERTVRKDPYTSLGIRVYETFQGYRLMITNADLEPRGIGTVEMMKNFGVDLLYLNLCIKQNCYRARLTPKPQRINLKYLRMKFPELTAEEAQLKMDWIAQYEANSKPFATCRLVKKYGRNRTSRIIDFHDRVSGVATSNPLA